MNYQMYLLAVYYRAQLVRLSDEIAQLAKTFTEGGEQKKEDKKRLRQLHTKFLKFMNRNWFLEVTNQDQGLELFNLMKKSMGLDPMYEQVKEEIQRADELAELIHQGEESRFNEKVGFVGGGLALIAVIIGIFGMNFKETSEIALGSYGIFSTVVVLIASGLGFSLSFAFRGSRLFSSAYSVFCGLAGFILSSLLLTKNGGWSFDGKNIGLTIFSFFLLFAGWSISGSIAQVRKKNCNIEKRG